MEDEIKSIMAVILTVLIITTAFAACSKKKATSAETTSATSASVVTATQPSTEAATEEQTDAAEPNAEDHGSGSGSSDNNNSGSSNKNSGSNKGSSNKGGSSGGSSAKKETTTQSTTKKEITTVKNVSAKEVQKEANAYIKSKGIPLDSSMTPDNASWANPVPNIQEDLNDGTALKHCKGGVDFVIKDYYRCNGQNPMSMYCYYDGSDFYILSW